MKKIASLLLALTLALSLMAPAIAVEPDNGIGVILNGKRVAFPDAAPELKDGRTMVPYRALMEALGGTVGYDEGRISCTLDGTALSFQLGEKTVTKTRDGKSETIQMDVPSYYQAGRTYVPVRFFAQALGYDVAWDDDARAAVLVDRDALIAELDSHFTVLNKVLQKVSTDSTKTYKSTMTYDIALDIKDDDTPVKGTIKLTMDMIYSATAMELSGKVNAAELLQSLDTSNNAMLDVLKSDIAFDLRMDLETGVFYASSPLAGIVLNTEADTWYKLDLAALTGSKSIYELFGMEDLSDLEEIEGTMGGVIYMVCRSLQSVGAIDADDLYETTVNAGGILAALLGDDAAKQSGETYSWTFGLDSLKQFGASDEDMAEIREVLEKCDITLTAGPDAMLKLDLDIRTKASEGDPSDSATVPAMSFTGTMTVTPTEEKINLKLDMGELGSAVYDLLLTIAETTEKPETTPPQGAEIVDLAEALGNLTVTPETAAIGIIGGVDGPTTAVQTTVVPAA